MAAFSPDISLFHTHLPPVQADLPSVLCRPFEKVYGHTVSTFSTAADSNDLTFSLGAGRLEEVINPVRPTFLTRAPTPLARVSRDHFLLPLVVPEQVRERTDHSHDRTREIPVRNDQVRERKDQVRNEKVRNDHVRDAQIRNDQSRSEQARERPGLVQEERPRYISRESRPQSREALLSEENAGVWADECESAAMEGFSSSSSRRSKEVDILRMGSVPNFLLADRDRAQKIFEPPLPPKLLASPLSPLLDTVRLDNMRLYLTEKLISWRTLRVSLFRLSSRLSWLEDCARSLVSATVRTNPLAVSGCANLLVDVWACIKRSLEEYCSLEDSFLELTILMRRVYQLALAEVADFRAFMLERAQDLRRAEGRQQAELQLRERSEMNLGDRVKYTPSTSRRGLATEEAIRFWFTAEEENSGSSSGAAGCTDNNNNNIPSQSVSPKQHKREIISKNNVFVFHVPPFMNKKDLRALFQQYGAVRSLHFPKDAPTRWGHRGFAFVCYENHLDALRAIFDLNGREIEVGRRLKVEFKRQSSGSSEEHSGYNNVNNSGSSNSAAHPELMFQEDEGPHEISRLLRRLSEELNGTSPPAMSNFTLDDEAGELPPAGAEFTQNFLALLTYQIAVLRKRCTNIPA